MNEYEYLARVESEVRVHGAAEGALEAAAAYHLEQPGRHNRARLLRAVAGRAVPAWKTVTVAAACELLHEASLVHDDLQDLDTERRGRPPVWKVFGEDAALLLGDHLMASAFAALATPRWHGEADQGPLLACLATAVQSAADGQFQQLSTSIDDEASRTVYERIARRKTGALIALPLMLGGVLRGLPLAQLDGLKQCGEHLGLAYQILDDMRALDEGAENRDLQQALLTAPVVEAKLMAPELDVLELLATGGVALDMVRQRARFWLARATGAALQEASALPQDVAHTVAAFVEAKLQAPAQAVSPQVAEPAEPLPLYASA